MASEEARATRAGPNAVESLFAELRDQALAMGIVDEGEAVKVSLDSTFMTYSRRGRKGAGARARFTYTCGKLPPNNGTIILGEDTHAKLIVEADSLKV